MDKKRLVKVIFIVVLLVLLAFVYRLIAMEYGFIVPCLFHEITGFYCPGCGITRMLFAILRLDFYQAFRYNALLFVALPFIGYCVFDYIIRFILNNENYFYRKISNRVWYFLLVIVLLFGILRNIPFFDFLTPTLI